MSHSLPILTAEEAAELIQNGQSIGFSGFTAAGAAKAVPAALAKKARREHEAGRQFKVGVLTGASTGKSLDGALAEAEAISFRTPYQSNPTLRKQINSGQVKFFDMHLSTVPQSARYGYLGPIHWAVVEACDITSGGGIVLSTSVGASNTYMRMAEKKCGRIPAHFLPLQSGVGNIANAVLAALGNSHDIPAFEMYTEVLQDSVIPLLENGRCTFASTCALTLSPDAMRKVTSDIDYFKKRIILRPQEISNHPEIVRRLGIVSMNTAIEIDLGGNVNSTHVMGKTMMNGIGGSGDFTRNAYLSIFSCPSTAKGGKISAIVPLASHMDHSEHSVQIVATEHGIADLRGRSPYERANEIIEK